MRALLDTCVIIDLLQKREPFFSDSYKLFLHIANRQFEGCVSAKSITDIYYLMHHYGHSQDTARKSLETIFKLLTVLDTAAIDCRKANVSDVSDFEDAVMIETAIRENMDCIVTRNTHDYQKSPISVFTPEQLIEKIENESHE